jgi:predicted secreted protein
MSISGGVALYFIIWWLTLFAVLPFGVRSQSDAGEVVHGSEPGAPTGFTWPRVAMINSIVAAVVFGVVWVVYVENYFNLAVINEITRR